MQNLKGKVEKEQRVPGDEKRVVQAIVDIDNEIVVGNGVNIWAWKLSVYEYSLKADQYPFRSDQIRRVTFNQEKNHNSEVQTC